jgi:uncharacterized membrane protein (UPF0127 family)
LKRSSAIVMLLLLCAFKCGSQPAPTPPPQNDKSPRIIFKDSFAVKVEVAADDEMRQQGLMYRDHLAEDRGMIFFFAQNGDYAFWMKNTIIPLDMIWIDESKKVVHVAHDVPPCQADPCPNYPPGVNARYVLEVAAGVAAKHHVANGDVLRFEGLDNVIVR